MSSSAIAILSMSLCVGLVGVTLLMVISARLRGEIDLLFRAFDRSERTLVPLVVEVRNDRCRLAERLERLSDAGPDPYQR